MTATRFESDFVRPGQPVVIRGLASHWPARSWDFHEIWRHFPSRKLRATGVSPPDGRRAIWSLTPDELAQRMTSDVDADSKAPRPDWLFDVHDELPELLEHLPPPPVCVGTSQYRLFMGRDTVTPGHYHSFQHALICLIHGTKRVLLYSPSDSPHLYPEPFAGDNPHYQSSQVDFAAPDAKRFPKVTSVRPLEVTLAPGDSLFVPVHWWHAVYGVGRVLSTSLFWNARLRDYRFPHPGLTAIAAVVRSHLGRGLRRVGNLAPQVARER